MGSLRTLNVHAPWTEILAAVDTPVEDRALPARVRCPMCEGARLTIYDDTISGGAWHYCFDCQRCGDMIELAAAVWKVSPAVAVRRLVAAGIPIPEDRVDAGTINRYVVAHPQYRNRMTGFWAKAREYLAKTGSPVLTGLRAKFRFDVAMSPGRWLEGPGNMVGAYPHLAIESVFAPKSVIGGRCVSDVRLFKGRGWSDVLVVPHYDLPGRICGFLMVGRNGLQEDRVFRVPCMRNQSQKHPGGYAEGGLACFWAVQNSHGMFGDHVVACGDPFLALRLHARHFASARTALPLVAYYDGRTARTRQAWAALDHKTPILWGWRLTPALVFQAIRAGGKLAVTELSDTSQFTIDHFVRNAEPRTIIQRIVKAAKPWREYLNHWAGRVPDGAVEELLAGLETYGVSPDELAGVGPAFAGTERIRTRPKQAMYGPMLVAERDGKTWLMPRNKTEADRGPVLLLNAILRIDGTSLLRTAGDGEPVVQYKGRLIYQGTEIPFEVSMNTFNNHLPRMLQTILTNGREGATIYVAPGWREKLVSAAKLLSGNV